MITCDFVGDILTSWNFLHFCISKKYVFGDLLEDFPASGANMLTVNTVVIDLGGETHVTRNCSTPLKPPSVPVVPAAGVEPARPKVEGF